ncbi:hypothetical protein EJB05_13353, partial [Eragrostis curvula]
MLAHPAFADLPVKQLAVPPWRVTAAAVPSLRRACHQPHPEYTDRVDTAAEKTYSIDRFNSGLPSLSKNGNAGKNRHARTAADLYHAGEYYNRKPWILEDETGQFQYQGQTEGLQSATATYYMLMMQGKDFHAILLVRVKTIDVGRSRREDE